MLIVGWGKGVKHIGSAGLMRCGNCGNVSLFNIVEVKKRVSLYFVSVAKWSGQWYLACSTCEAAIELNRAQKDEMLRASVDLPPDEAITETWSVYNDAAEKAILSSGLSLDELEAALRESLDSSDRILRSRYPDQYCDYVKYYFVKDLLERMEPEQAISTHANSPARPQ